MADKDKPQQTTGNGTYATGGLQGQGKRHKGEHRAPSVLDKLFSKGKKGSGK